MRTVLAAAALALVFSLFGTPLYIRFLVKRGYAAMAHDERPPLGRQEHVRRRDHAAPHVA